MDRDRIEALMAEEFTPARLRPLQIIYLALVMGVVVLFGVGTFLGLQSTGEEVDEVAALMAYVGMGAPVVLYFVSNQIFAYMIARGDVEGDALGAVRAALIAKAGLVEVGAMIGGVAWLMLCLQTNVAHIPQIYFGVFLGPLAMLLNAMHYFPTPERISWWLLSREV